MLDAFLISSFAYRCFKELWFSAFYCTLPGEICHPQGFSLPASSMSRAPPTLNDLNFFFPAIICVLDMILVSSASYSSENETYLSN